MPQSDRLAPMMGSDLSLLTEQQGSLQAQCDALIAAGLEAQLLFPSDAAYDDRLESWWSVQSRLRPSCIFQPSTPEDVSRAVSALSSALSRLGGPGRFAIRSGGHSQWAGGSNVDGGVTIDLGKLNQVTSSYHEGRAVVSIGPGQTWGSVYDTLEPLGVMVTGGRVRDVGVGGLVTGGGISFFNGLHGFSCDSVVNFQVVLADGRIVEANAASPYADLWKGLKGGSGNLGIVTRIDMEAFPARNLWGGLHFSERSNLPKALEAIVRFTDTHEDHPETSHILSIIYNPIVRAEGTFINQILVNTSGLANPAVFREALEIPSFFNSLEERSMCEFTDSFKFPSGLANIWMTLTFKNDIRILQKSVELHDALVAALLAVIPASEFAAQNIWQPLPRQFSDISLRKGGNVFGLDAAEGNCIMWLVNITLKDMQFEALARQKTVELKDALERYGTELGILVPWVYLNYADGTQDPLGSYGEENLRFLREVSRKYDPEGFFQRNFPGGFTLSRTG